MGRRGAWVCKPGSKGRTRPEGEVLDEQRVGLCHLRLIRCQIRGSPLRRRRLPARLLLAALSGPQRTPSHDALEAYDQTDPHPLRQTLNPMRQNRAWGGACCSVQLEGQTASPNYDCMFTCTKRSADAYASRRLQNWLADLDPPAQHADARMREQRMRGRRQERGECAH